MILGLSFWNGTVQQQGRCPDLLFLLAFYTFMFPRIERTHSITFPDLEENVPISENISLSKLAAFYTLEEPLKHVALKR